jgi:hypothetical protein
MKTFFLTVALISFGFIIHAQTTITNAGPAKASSGATFWHHSGEITIAPSADYFIYAKGTSTSEAKPYEYKLPFIGYNINGQYLYRPVEVFAISAGLGFRLQGLFTRKTTYSGSKKYVSERDVDYTGYLNIPIEIHFFKKMQKCTFEFATGPQFNFPANWRSHSITFKPNGDNKFDDIDGGKYSTEEMRTFSSLGWNVLVGAEFNVAPHVNIFVGPQINFVNLAFFDKNRQKQRTHWGDRFDCSLGLKLGFRFH